MPLQQLGPYRIERTLGRGGMGTVYAGVHCETGERVAIKVLAEALAVDPRFRERFLAEVETLKTLRHEHIVTLRGYGEDGDRLFFVMELVDGPSLDAALRDGRRFSWLEVVDLTTQICAALKHAHDNGVIHRDLKPANLLLTPDGKVKLTDFGIAKFFGSNGLTMAGSLVGTPDYMSPEQAEGQPVTPRSDLYSLGCVMYALFTGKPPFFGASVTQVIDSVRFREPTPLRMAAPQVPEALSDIVAQLLRKRPEDRIATPQSLSNLLQAMRHALSLEKTSVKPPPVPSASDGVATVRRALGRKASEHTAAADMTSEGPTMDYAPDEAARRGAPRTVSQGSGPEPLPTQEFAANDASAEFEIAAAVPRHDHFTTVSEDDWKRHVGAASAERWSRNEWLAVAGLALGVIAIITTFVVVLRPPSADRLYTQIQQLSQQAEPADDYDTVLQDFLARYPDDTRAAEVTALREGYLCARLRQDLLHKLRSLTELEKLYLKGMVMADEQQFAEARECFQQIVDVCQATAFNRMDRVLLDRAQTMLKRIASLQSAANVDPGA